MKRSIMLGLGGLLAIAGIIWTLQGLDLLGQTGGMNGHIIWALIGPVTAVAGLFLVRQGTRTER